jgi:hypothetical protein
VKLLLLIFMPFCLVWFATRNRRAAYRWLGFGVIFVVQTLSLLPVGAIIFALYGAGENETLAAGNNFMLGSLYGDFRVTQGAFTRFKRLARCRYFRRLWLSDLRAIWRQSHL